MKYQTKMYQNFKIRLWLASKLKQSHTWSKTQEEARQWTNNLRAEVW